MVAAAGVAREQEAADRLEKGCVKGLHVASFQCLWNSGLPDFVQARRGNVGPFDLGPAPLLRGWITRLACVSELPETGKIGILKLNMPITLTISPATNKNSVRPSGPLDVGLLVMQTPIKNRLAKISIMPINVTLRAFFMPFSSLTS